MLSKDRNFFNLTFDNNYINNVPGTFVKTNNCRNYWNKMYAKRHENEEESSMWKTALEKHPINTNVTNPEPNRDACCVFYILKSAAENNVTPPPLSEEIDKLSDAMKKFLEHIVKSAKILTKDIAYQFFMKAIQFFQVGTSWEEAKASFNREAIDYNSLIDLLQTGTYDEYVGLLLRILEQILGYYKAKTPENRRLTEGYLMKHRQINVEIVNSGPNSCASFARSALLEAVDQMNKAVERLMKKNVGQKKKRKSSLAIEELHNYCVNPIVKRRGAFVSTDKHASMKLSPTSEGASNRAWKDYNDNVYTNLKGQFIDPVTKCQILQGGLRAHNRENANIDCQGLTAIHIE